MVVSVPLALVGLLLFSAFAFTMAFSRRGQTETDALQQARTALHFMAQELRETTADNRAIRLWSRLEGAPHEAIGFLTARADRPGRTAGTDARGVMVWQGSAYYVHDAARQELRRITGTPHLPEVISEVTGGRLMARHVSAFHVQRAPGLITVQLTVRLPSGEKVLATTVRPRN